MEAKPLREATEAATGRVSPLLHVNTHRLPSSGGQTADPPVSKVVIVYLQQA